MPSYFLGDFTEYPYNNSNGTINLIVAVTIVLLNLYITSGSSCQILHVVLSIHFPDV